jgi:hypothetical protein
MGNAASGSRLAIVAFASSAPSSRCRAGEQRRLEGSAAHFLVLIHPSQAIHLCHYNKQAQQITCATVCTQLHRRRSEIPQYRTLNSSTQLCGLDDARVRRHRCGVPRGDALVAATVHAMMGDR